MWTSLTHELVFDYHEGDVFWCTADVGWITGHSYIVFGPMINGATQVFFEGTPTYPDAGRFWEVVERLGVTQFYTAPTAIRALMAKGDEPVTRHDRSSLRVLGTVGEPINPEAWRWYHEVVGEGRCSVVDTWWQTETGGHMLTPLPGATPEKPGSATRPFFGVVPQVLSQEGEVLEGEGEGLLVLARSWPRPGADGLPRPRPLRHDLLHRLPPARTSPATAAAATPTATTGSPAASTT